MPHRRLTQHCWHGGKRYLHSTRKANTLLLTPKKKKGSRRSSAEDKIPIWKLRSSKLVSVIFSDSCADGHVRVDAATPLEPFRTLTGSSVVSLGERSTLWLTTASVDNLT